MFDDSIQLNVTVDWEWVSENVGFLLENGDLIIGIAETFGLGDTNSSSNIIEDVLQDFSFDLETLFPDLGDDNVTTNDISDAISDLVEGALGNQTTVLIGNTTLNIMDLLDQIFNSTAFLNATSGVNGVNGTSVEGQLSFNSLEFVNNTIVLRDVTLAINDVSVDIGDVTLTEAQLQAVLPSGTITYTLFVPAEYSVMHNSSSPHGVGAFIGELTAAAFSVSLQFLCEIL